MRLSKLYLQDIVDAADAVSSFIGNLDKQGFLDSDLIRSAVLQKLTMIGEASAHLPLELHQRYSAVEWRDVVAFRNLAIHAYFAVDRDIVWQAATKDAPELREYVSRILAEEYPEQ